MKLELAEGLSLPLDVVTQTIAILAKRRAGKSYTARRLAEQLLRARQQVVIVDPKGDHWGIRSAGDGRSPGFSVTILGGERGDLPLEVDSGELVAKLAAEDQVNLLLDLSQFRKHQVATFMTGFLENLYRIKAREAFRTPMMLVVDEADAIAPQKPQKGEERMLGAAEDIVRRGGQRGIGCCLVTQRSAVLNKNVLTQAQMLVVLRTIAPQDIKAMEAWIEVHGTEEEALELIDSLPALPIGDAWFWAPGWPTEKGIFRRAHVLPIETFDSGATPRAGEKRVEPKNLADVDLAVLEKQMAAVVKRTKENDPRELKRRIAELERENKAIAAAVVKANEVEKRIEISVFKPGDLARAEKLAERMTVTYEKLANVGALLMEHARTLGTLIARARGSGSPAPAAVQARIEPGARASVPRSTPAPPAPARRAGPSGAAAGLPRAEKRILQALAQYRIGRTKRQVAVLTGYAISGGGFNNALGALRKQGLIEGSDPLSITEEGLQELGNGWEPLPTGRALLEHWMGQLPKAERAILECVAGQYPNGIAKNALADSTGYEATGGGFNNALGRLRTLELIDGSGVLRASEELFG